MNKSCLHSTVINTFNRLIGKFPIAIDHDDYVHQVLISTIGHLDYNAPRPFKGDERGGGRTEGGNLIAAFPDFLLKIQVNATVTKPRVIPKWVGEVAFTTSASRTRDQLQDVITSNPTVDLAFLFVIDESPKWESPTSENSFAQQLSTQPVMKYVDFNHKVDGNGMGPINFGGITWASVSRVALEVYMRSPENGALTIDENEQSNLYLARGVCLHSAFFMPTDAIIATLSINLHGAGRSLTRWRLRSIQNVIPCCHRVGHRNARIHRTSAPIKGQLGDTLGQLPPLPTNRCL